MSQMNKCERLTAAVGGGKADRTPVSFWYHFRLPHPSGEPLAEAETAFARKYDPDFLKVMHDLWLDLPDGMTRIEDPADWEKLRRIDPRGGNFAEQLKTLDLLRRNLSDEMPIIDTVFNPFAAANKLCGKNIMDHYRDNPKAVKHGLEAIALSLADYCRAWIEDGGIGIFYALDGAMPSFMPADEYAEVFMPLDRLILEAAMEKGPFNFLHLHGVGVYFDILHDLPCHAVNWASRTTYPSLSEARKTHKGCIADGVDEVTIAEKTPAEVTAESLASIAEAGAEGFILTPGCAVPTETPEENLLAMRRAVE
jgi:uroporphyrinogen decarboxylase